MRNEDLRSRLQDLKEWLKLSKLAKETGLSVPFITAFVRGEKNMSQENLIKVEEVLKNIFGGTE